MSRAIVSGFLAGVAALFVLIPAYGFAAAVGSTSSTATPLSRALWNLSHNPVTSLVDSVQLVQAIGLHLVVGLGWAVVYAAVVEPKLYGPGWRKGLVFAIVPCLISLFVFLPLVGAGPFGLAVGAGPLAGLGAILLHAIYGVLLGETYALADGEGMGDGVDNPMAKAITLVERDMALGLVLGAALGALIAGILAVTGNGANLATIAAAATEGALCGVIIGVVIGLLTAE